MFPNIRGLAKILTYTLTRYQNRKTICKKKNLQDEAEGREVVFGEAAAYSIIKEKEKLTLGLGQKEILLF